MSPGTPGARIVRPFISSSLVTGRLEITMLGPLACRASTFTPPNSFGLNFWKKSHPTCAPTQPVGIPTGSPIASVTGMRPGV
ncbi:MAG: hypothetical protein M5U08_15745 [Burkholderiales bacterium]|nr:hypothetical protein [Burkholderiales bacterium]